MIVSKVFRATNAIKAISKYGSRTTGVYNASPHIIIRNLHQGRAESENSHANRQWKSMIGIGLGGIALYYIFNDPKVVLLKESKSSKKIEETSPEKFVDGLPIYGYEDVAKHSSKESGIWVTYKYGVYDITSFIASHPGGEQILEAAGTSIEPFWDLYQQHNNPEIQGILESYRIGNYKDAREPDGESGLWSNQPIRDPRLIVRSEKPCNAETPPELLSESFITQSNLFYVRHHLPVPEVDLKHYNLTISTEGGSGKTLKLTLDDLKKFPKHSVTAALMCAGNRRSQMNKHKSTKGLDWGPGAVGNAVWSGARLKDVLEAAGVKPDDTKHVQFNGMDMDATGKPYGASIPLFIAMDENKDVILAYEMNNHPIPRDHGHPVRAFVPGTVGARCVKWLNNITISGEESLSHWQRLDYKGFHPSVEPDTADYSKSTSIQYLPVTSAFLSPQNGYTVSKKDEYVEVKGYAWSGGGQKVIRIDLTCDKGKSWMDGTIEQQDKMPAGRHWGWTLWKAKIPIPKGKKEVEIWVKAVDSNYNTQPENVENIWNMRGVLNNSYDKINIKIK